MYRPAKGPQPQKFDSWFHVAISLLKCMFMIQQAVILPSKPQCFFTHKFINQWLQQATRHVRKFKNIYWQIHVNMVKKKSTDDHGGADIRKLDINSATHKKSIDIKRTDYTTLWDIHISYFCLQILRKTNNWGNYFILNTRFCKAIWSNKCNSYSEKPE